MHWQKPKETQNRLRGKVTTLVIQFCIVKVHLLYIITFHSFWDLSIIKPRISLFYPPASGEFRKT